MFEVSALVPLALLFFGLHRSGSASAAPAAKPAAKSAPKPAAKPAPPKPAAKPAAAQPKGKMYLHPAKPAAAAPKTETEGADQAAVNAAVSQAIREEIARNAGQPLPASIVEAPAPSAPTEVVRSPKKAAQDLRAFLLKTGRFGTLKDRPEEVKAAQRDLGLTDDGIVGPRTRAAAKAQGVTLPPLNPKKK